MNDVLTVMRKEIVEMFGDRHSMYGAVIQTVIIIAICGVIVPADNPMVWGDAGQVAILYAVFPAILAATFAADSFAGERERGTMETLLATPISERSLFLGKVITAILLAAAGAALALVAGVISSTAVMGNLPESISAKHVTIVLLGAVGYSSLTAVVATQISMGVTVARTAQQVSSMISIVITAALAFVLRRFSINLDWDTLPQVTGVLLAIGVALVVIGDGRFRRHRIFDPRGLRHPGEAS
jgi:ABC-2 type transport system permease protein